MHALHRTLLICLSLSAAQACASDLKIKGDDGPDEAMEDEGAVSGKFKTAPQADGSTVTRIDATSEDEWEQYDLDSGKDAPGEHEWDLAFSRFKIKTNGGVSGSDGVYVASLPGMAFKSVTKAPDEGFQADRPDSDEDADMNPDNVFNSGPEDWYEYNLKTHALTPKDITYVIASTEQKFYKFRVEGYYDSAGTDAMLKVRWEAIDAPDSGFPPVAAGGEAEAGKPAADSGP